MAINLFEAAKGLKVTKFEFVATQKVITNARKADDGTETKSSFYLVLELKETMPEVFGASKLYDPFTNERIPVLVENVTHINVYADIVEKYQSEFIDIVESDNSFSGRYEGDLFLDVSKDSEVWLTDVKFQDFGKANARAKRESRLNVIRERLGKRATK